ncbi:Com family DNA-binding transcriptional regulator [Undibacterium sp. TC9W]|uniref:Com family DNA-binding transcriptional regulator n=1 Tax=Undibacterium sp. TC9W TaxID=3413053 RepID=UPI003BF050D9
MQTIRCGSCSRKLGEGEFVTLAIKCPRCKTLNHLRATSSTSNTGANIEQTTSTMDGRQAPSGKTHIAPVS